MQTLTLNIKGMSCGGCVSAIERAVGELSGVSSVAVDLSAAQAVVVYDDSQVKPSAISTVIEDAGFDVQ